MDTIASSFSAKQCQTTSNTMPCLSRPVEMPGSLFTHLPQELLDIVIDHCDVREISRLTRTCRLMHWRLIAALYETVDLAHDYRWNVPAMQRQALDRYRSLQEVDFQLHWKQQALMRTLRARPEYGQHIRKWVWTLLPGWQRHRFRRGYRAWTEQRLERWSDADITFMSRCMSHCDHVEIGAVRRAEAWTCSAPHFPSATSLQLSGRFACNLAAQILGCNQPNLRHLTLDDMLVIGCTRQWPRASLGPPWPSQGQWPALRSLRLRRLAQSNTGPRPRSTFINVERFKEWMPFIERLTASLEEFHFEQTGPWERSEDPVALRWHLRTMDRVFSRHMLPVLAQGPWPRLKRMTLTEIKSGFWDRDREVFRTCDGPGAVRTHDLRRAVGPRAELVVRERPAPPDETRAGKAIKPRVFCLACLGFCDYHDDDDSLVV